MSAITIGNDLIHYEVLGRGRPVILVHGWLGSWRYWVPAMQQLSLKYRVYAIDLFGFGDSGKDARHYDVLSQVRMLREFVDKLGIGKAALIGHSLGGVVTMLFASEYRDLVARMMLISLPLWDQGSLPDLNAEQTVNKRPAVVTEISDRAPRRQVDSYSPEERASAADVTRMKFDRAKLLEAHEEYRSSPTANGLSADDLAKLDRIKDAAKSSSAANPGINMPLSIARQTGTGALISPPGLGTPPPLRGESPLGILRTGDPVSLLMRFIDRSSPDLDKLRAEVGKTAPDAIDKTAASLSNFNLALTLHRITTPTLLLHGEDDPLLPAPSDELLDRVRVGKKLGAFLDFMEPGVRHFPMLEIGARFNRLLMDFLEAPTLSDIQFRDTWTRTIR